MISPYINVFVYDKITGVIIQRMQGEEAGILAVLTAEQDIKPVVEGVDARLMYVHPTTKEYTNYPTAKPHAAAHWDGDKWVDPRSLSTLKLAKWEEMKRAREAATNATIVTPLGDFDADPTSRAALTELVVNAVVGETFKLFKADNTVATISYVQLRQLTKLVSQQVQTAFDKSILKRQAIADATTKAQVAAIVW